MTLAQPERFRRRGGGWMPVNSASQQYVTDNRDSMAAAPTDVAGSFDLLRVAARRAIDQTRKWLVSRQDADGSWCAELEGDTILESETILLLAFLGREDDGAGPAAAAYLLEKQLPEGGWAMYPGGAGGNQRQREGLFRPEAHRPRPRRANPCSGPAQAILAHGGADAVNSYTRFYPGPAGPDLLRAMSGRAAGGGAAAQMVSGEFATPSAPGRGRSSCRCRSSRPCSRCGRSSRGCGIRELFLPRAARIGRRCDARGCPAARGLLSWDRFFRTRRRGC